MHSALLGIIARAASPEERDAAHGFAAEAGAMDAVAQRRAAEWMHTIGAGDAARTRAVLAEHGLSADDWEQRLRDVRIVDRRALPSWATELIALVQAATDAPAVTTSAELPAFTVDEVLRPGTPSADARERSVLWSHGDALAPFLHVARQRLDRTIKSTGASVASSARRQMLALVAHRWNDLLADVLSTWTDPNGRGTVEAWMRLFTVAPVSARLLAVVYRNWREHIEELLRRLVRDRLQLDAAFGAGAPLGRLERLVGDAGDLHHHGRAVAILEFARGPAGPRRVVYKPKDMRVARIVTDIVQLLNSADLAPALHVRTIVTRRGYGWDEFVPTAPCRDVPQVRRFYCRMGMLSRLFQLLDATDCIAGNVIAHGEFPVLIDLETILSPRIALEPTVTPADRAIAERLWDAPYRSGLITAKIAGLRDQSPMDFGAMGIDPAMPDLGDAVPRLHGRPVRVADYFADVMLGYRRMGQCLAQRADALTADDGPLGRTAGVPVRFVYRNTHIYVRLLAESVRPARLRDGVDRARCLDRLWLAHAPGGAPAAIHAAEVAALRDGDIPLFTARTDRWELETSLGVTVPNVCEGSALARARSRLRSLAAGGAAAERDAIRTALFTLRPDVRMTPHGGRAARGARARSGDDNAWLSAACAIGDAIRRSAIPVPGGEWTWIGVQYGASTGAWRYGQLAPELLSGTAGLAIVFADLYRLSGLSRFQHAARRTLPLILRRLAAGPTDGGGFLGWGAAFYAGYRCAVALSDFVLASAIVDQALELLMASPLQENTTRDAADVVRGQPGLLLALLSARSATQAARHVASVGITGRAGALVRPGPLEGLPGPAAATAMARQRLAAITGVSDRTPCWTLPTPHTTGNILAYLDGSRHEPAMRDAAIWGARATVAALRRTGRTRALVEAVDVAVTAWQVSGASRDLVAARAGARTLIDRNRRTGQWFPDLLAADRHNLSVVTGIGAVAHALMRVHAPEQVASVRLLEASC